MEAFIYEMLNVQNVLENSYGRRELGYCTIVGGGFFGRFGDIVVDQIHKPKYVIGVSEGNGSLKKELNKDDKSNIKQLKEEFNIEK